MELWLPIALGKQIEAQNLPKGQQAAVLCPAQGKHDSHVGVMGNGVSSRHRIFPGCHSALPFSSEDRLVGREPVPRMGSWDNVHNHSKLQEVEGQLSRSPASLLGPGASAGATGEITRRPTRISLLELQGHLRSTPPTGKAHQPRHCLPPTRKTPT